MNRQKKVIQRRWTSLWLVIVWMTMMTPLSIFANEGVTLIQYDGSIHKYQQFPDIYIEGVKMKPGVMPAVVTPADTTMVPVREFFESIGATVDWDKTLEQAYILYENSLLVVQIDNYKAYVNGEEYELIESPKYMINKSEESYQAKTMVPLRFILEVFDYEVEWNQEDYSIHVTNKVSKPETTQKMDSVVWKDNSHQSGSNQGTTNIHLTEGNYKDTNILGIYPQEKSNNQLEYIIKADSAISKVETTTWEDVLIIDIIGSFKTFEEEVIPLENDPYFKQIRSSQYAYKPNVTRVVFDMKYEDINYDLSLNEERTELSLKIGQNHIHQIEVAQDDQGDYLDLTGLQKPALDIFWLTDPPRLVVDVPYSTSNIKYFEEKAKGEFVVGVRGAQFDEDTTRIVLDLKERCEYVLENGGDNTTRVRLVAPSYHNVEVDYVGYPRLILKKPTKDLSIQDVVFEDKYLEKKATFSIKSDKLKLAYGLGRISVNDDDIREVMLSQDSDSFNINISTKKIKGYTVTEDENNLYINILTPKEAYGNVIVVDPGHGGTDPGKAIDSRNKVGKNEKELNLDICLRLYEQLEANEDIKVYMTRTTDETLVLTDRPEMANEINADFFLSVHNNAQNMPSIKGVEVYYYTTDPATMSFSKSLNKHIIAENKSDDRGLRYGDYLVLRETKMTAALVEIGYMTNVVDAKRLNDPNFLQKTADGLYKGVVEAFEKLR